MENAGSRSPDGGPDEDWLEDVSFDAAGLVPVIAQSVEGGRVLMLAWADRAALAATRRSGYATYFSRSRRRQWRKGEESGHTQHVREIRLDCDGDAVLYLVDQEGGIACHTGRPSCFFRKLNEGQWSVTDVPPALLAPGATRA